MSGTLSLSLWEAIIQLLDLYQPPADIHMDNVYFHDGTTANYDSMLVIK